MWVQTTHFQILIICLFINEENKQPYHEICITSLLTDLDSFKEELTEFEDDIGLLVNDDMHIITTGMKARAGEAIRQIYTNGSFLDDIAGAVQVYDSYHTF